MDFTGNTFGYRMYPGSFIVIAFSPLTCKVEGGGGGVVGRQVFLKFFQDDFSYPKVSFNNENV